MPNDDKPTDPTPGSASVKPHGGDRPLAERIQAAKDAAQRRRVEQGLPAEADDGPFAEEAGRAWRKGKPKR